MKIKKKFRRKEESHFELAFSSYLFSKKGGHFLLKSKITDFKLTMAAVR